MEPPTEIFQQVYINSCNTPSNSCRKAILERSFPTAPNRVQAVLYRVINNNHVLGPGLYLPGDIHGEWATLDRLILVTDVVMSHASSAMTPRWKSDMLPNVLHANYLSFFILTLLDQAF